VDNKSLSVRKQLLLNTLTGWALVVVRMALALYLVPFLLLHLGRDGYGVVGLLGVLLSLSSVADLGLRQALGRELAEKQTRADYITYNRLASTCFALYVGIGFLLALGSLIFASYLVDVFKVPDSLRANAVRVVCLYGAASFLMVFAGAVFSAALTSVNRFDIRNKIEAIGTLFSGVLLIAALRFVPNTLLGWAIFMLLGQVIVLVLQISAVRRSCPWFSIKPHLVDLACLPEVLLFGSKVYLMQLTNLVSERVDPLIISRYFGPAGVSLYMPAAKLSGIQRALVLVLATQMHPLATRRHVEQDLESQQRMLIDGSRFTLVLGALFSVPIFVFAESFSAVWLRSVLGDEHLVVAQLMRLWAIIDLILCAASIQWPLLLGSRKIDVLVYMQTASALVGIGIAVYLTGYGGFGPVGVLVGALVGTLMFRPALIVYGARVYKISILTYTTKALLGPCVVAAGLFVSALFLRGWAQPADMKTLLLCAGACGSVWLVLAAFVGLTSGERKKIQKYLGRVLSRC
jgi:O-antigen/teichoic acid export membrane protein